MLTELLEKPSLWKKIIYIIRYFFDYDNLQKDLEKEIRKQEAAISFTELLAQERANSNQLQL